MLCGMKIIFQYIIIKVAIKDIINILFLFLWTFFFGIYISPCVFYFSIKLLPVISTVKELDKDYYDVVILNYANGDMVGHTGDYDAAVSAVEFLDVCLKRIYDKINEKVFIPLNFSSTPPS